MAIKNPFKKKTEFDKLKEAFSFMGKEFGYRLETGETKSYYKGNNLLIYRNDHYGKQVEICGGGQFFHAIIREIKNGQLGGYRKRKRNIGFETLAILDNPHYDHFDFYAGGEIGLKGVIANTVNLFKRQKEFFTSQKWVDFHKVKELQDASYLRDFGRPRPPRRKSRTKKIRNLIAKEYPEVSLTFDNRDLPFYHIDNTLQKLVFVIGTKSVTLAQVDYRDFPNDYQILLDGEVQEEFGVLHAEERLLEFFKKLKPSETAS